jgi:hypothetical protein
MLGYCPENKVAFRANEDEGIGYTYRGGSDLGTPRVRRAIADVHQESAEIASCWSITVATNAFVDGQALSVNGWPERGTLDSVEDNFSTAFTGENR